MTGNKGMDHGLPGAELAGKVLHEATDAISSVANFLGLKAEHFEHKRLQQSDDGSQIALAPLEFDWRD